MYIPYSMFIDLGDDPMGVIESMHSLTFTLSPPGTILTSLLETASQGKPLSIVETGCLRDTSFRACFDDGWSTYYFARWVKAHPGSKLTTIELEPENIKTCMNFLREKDLLAYADFTCGNSVSMLKNSPADFYFLDSCDGLEHGLAEFQAALQHKPKTIIMDDIQTKAQSAIDYAKSNGIPNCIENRYAVFNTVGL